MKDIKLDSFEKEIEKNAEQFVKESKKTQQRVTRIFSKANKKNRIALRLNNQTLESIKRKAQEEGLPYQTFISSILYKYVNDRLMDEKHILKSLRLLNRQSEHGKPLQTQAQDEFSLTPQAFRIWINIPGDIQMKILNNVWCRTCSDTTGIGSVSGKVEN